MMALNSPFSTALDESKIKAIVRAEMKEFIRDFHNSVVSPSLRKITAEIFEFKQRIGVWEKESKFNSMEDLRGFVAAEIKKLQSFYQKIYEYNQKLFKEIEKK